MPRAPVAAAAPHTVLGATGASEGAPLELRALVAQLSAPLPPATIVTTCGPQHTTTPASTLTNSTTTTPATAACTCAEASCDPLSPAAPPFVEPTARVTRYPRLLPGPSLVAPPDPRVAEVWPGCRTRPYGTPGLPDFVVYCQDEQGRNVSYWHDVPLNLTTHPGGAVTLWVTNEIPKGTNAKVQTVTALPHTPMAQDRTEDGTPRYYRVGPSLVNYGGIPQTWEASDVADAITGLTADNDPVDFLELGSAPLPVGAVVRVKLLGALSLIDQGETDWKVLVINVKDPAADEWDDIADVPAATRQRLFSFFHTYKVAEGKQLNHFHAFPPTPGTSTNAGGAAAAAQPGNGTAAAAFVQAAAAAAASRSAAGAGAGAGAGAAVRAMGGTADGAAGGVGAAVPAAAAVATGTASAAQGASTAAPPTVDWRTAYLGRDGAAEVLRRGHGQWRRLLAGGCATQRCMPLLAAARVQQGGGV